MESYGLSMVHLPGNVKKGREVLPISALKHEK